MAYVHTLEGIIGKTIGRASYVKNSNGAMICLQFVDGDYCYVIPEDFVTPVGLATDTETVHVERDRLVCRSCGSDIYGLAK